MEKGGVGGGEGGLLVRASLHTGRVDLPRAGKEDKVKFLGESGQKVI